MKGTFETIVNEDRPVIVDFHALWCGPCKVQSPILKQVADELGERVRVIKIDVDVNQEIAGKFRRVRDAAGANEYFILIQDGHGSSSAATLEKYSFATPLRNSN